MKKILSIALVLCMVFAMAITANAATTGYMEFEASANEVTVGETFTVTLNYIPGADSAFKGGTIKFEFDKTYATLNGELSTDTDGTLTNNLVNIKPANNLYTVKHLANASDDWTTLTEAGAFTVLEFEAVAAGEFTISCGTASVTFADATNTDRLTYKGTSIEPITITIKEPAADPEKVYGDKIDAATTLETEEAIYTNVAIVEVDMAADADVDAEGEYYGFELTNGTDVKDVQLGASIAGAGVIEYVVALYGVPDGVTISATPYVMKVVD